MQAHATLPPLRGRVQRDAPLGAATWFRVGGPAEVLVRPADADDLLLLLRDLPDDVPLTVIGAVSNMIIRDGGVAGVVVRLARGFGDIAVEADGIIAGAAALDVTVAETAAAHALAGLEFLVGIPGTIGGAVAMNAGAYGADVKDVLDWAEVATPAGLLRLSAADLHFAYRHAALPARAVVTRARFHATPGDAAAIAAANVGIGVQGGAEACLATADVYLTRSDLSALVELTDGSRRTLRVIRRNIALSIAYNVVGASMAMFGLLTPLAAAILMPASSITVVLGSRIASRPKASR